MNLTSWLITYWWVAVTMDWTSTIVAHDYRVEENPFMRWAWQSYGEIGFTIATTLFGIVYTVIFYYALKYRFVWQVTTAGLAIITFKVIIALTNLAIVPYCFTEWFSFSWLS